MSEVHVYEVGARDGLQNEPRKISWKARCEFISALAAAGIADLEVGLFVRPDLVPQMADSERIYRAIEARRIALGVSRPWALVPNEKGLERALSVGARSLAVFTGATESFVKKNIGMSVAESLSRFASVVKLGRAAGAEFKGYVSTAFYCPFEGKVPAAKALDVSERLLSLGVTRVSISDTIGAATPNDIEAVFREAIRRFGADRVSAHFHDTRGTALANTLRALDLGVRHVESSAGGLGGCPFAPGATGNLATEDLVYMLEGMGLKTGIDLGALCEASLSLARSMKRPLTSRYLQAYLAQKNRRRAQKKKKQ